MIKPILLSVFISIASLLFAQNVCNPNAKLFLFSNYDGGIVTINVDQNIPNIVIGICTYEPVQVNITGTFANNVAQVVYAGFNSTQNNNNCGQGNFITSISGVPANIAQIITIPPANLSDPNGYPFIICTDGNCTTSSNTGGCNTIEQIVAYFTQLTNTQLYAHRTQYQCWQNTVYQISQGGNCCVQANVTNPPTATITANTTSICANQCVDFSSANSLGGPFSSVLWNIPGANPSTSNLSNPTICFPNSGTYSVSLTVTNSTGSDTETLSGFINVGSSPAPVVQFSYPNTICENDITVNPTLASNFTTGGVFSSSAGLSINPTTGVISAANSSTGNYTVTYTAPAGNCLIPGSNIGSTNVVIESTPTVSVTPSGNLSICSGSNITLNATPGFASYNWQNVNSTNQTALINQAGSYSVFATSASGCIGESNVVNVSIENSPTIIITPSDTLRFCNGLSGNLIAQSGFSNYVWSNNQNGQSISVNTSGNYTVSALSPNGCVSNSEPVYVDVVSPPTASFTTSQDVSLTINFLYTGTGATSFLWNFGFNNVTSTEQNPIQEFPNNALYNITLTVSNNCGTNTFSAQVDVLKLSLASLQDYDFKVISVDGTWIIFPSESFNYKLKSAKLFNSLGQMVWQNQINNSDNIIVPFSESGIYFIQLETEKGTITGKLMGIKL